MTSYRRNFAPGASYFFTVNLRDRRSRLLFDHVELLRAAFRATHRRHMFTIDAIAVLPDHLHTTWTLPEADADFPLRWALIKADFSRRLPKAEPISQSRLRKRERGIWQRRFWEYTLRDENDFARHIDYIHYNPIKHGHVDRVADWPFSSFHRMVRLGIYSEDWAGAADEENSAFGER